MFLLIILLYIHISFISIVSKLVVVLRKYIQYLMPQALLQLWL